MLIGITGRAGEGKTTIAEHLAKHRGFTILSFATPVKEAVSKLFGIPMHVLLDPVKKNQMLPTWGKSARIIMQTFGTECMRNHFGTDFWVNFMVRKIDWHASYDIVIDDVRFQEEVDTIVGKGGQMIRVIRPGIPFAIGVEHVSEQIDRLRHSAFALHNTETINALHTKTDQLIEAMEDERFRE